MIIIRDPKYFEIILSFLRTSKWDIPATISKGKVLGEAEFYMLKTKTPLEQTNPMPTGLYIGTTGEYLFILGGYCISSNYSTHSKKTSIVLSENMLALKEKDRLCLGIFLNDRRNFIMDDGYPRYMKVEPTAIPPKLFTQKIKKQDVTVEANPEIVIFYLKQEKIGDCRYKVGTASKLVYASYRGRELKIKIYFFGNKMVVDVNGEWKFCNADK